LDWWIIISVLVGGGIAKKLLLLSTLEESNVARISKSLLPGGWSVLLSSTDLLQCNCRENSSQHKMETKMPSISPVLS
jgi:hypothetical protein